MSSQAMEEGTPNALPKLTVCDGETNKFKRSTSFSRLLKKVSSQVLIKQTTSFKKPNFKRSKKDEEKKKSTGSDEHCSKNKKQPFKVNSSSGLFKRKKKKESFRLVLIEEGLSEHTIPLPETLNPSLIIKSDLFDIQTVSEDESEADNVTDRVPLVADMQSNYFNSEGLPPKALPFASSGTSFGKFDIKTPIRENLQDDI